jgi:dTDP-4-dehydrorhamnose 3,5-epimerase
LRFRETSLSGAYLIEPELLNDERGFFARTYCRKEFEENGLNPELSQCDISFNKNRGTLRGMHYQVEPHAEVKLVRCTMGAIFDVIIDIRQGSPTFKQRAAFDLTEENRNMLYIPKGFAHGFQTLEDNTEVFYQISEFYVPECARGIRWDDPVLAINWPLSNPIVSPKDQLLSNYRA